MDKPLIDCFHHENWGSFQLNCHIVSLILFPDDRKTRQTWLLISGEFCFDLLFFSTLGKHISHVHVSFIFVKFTKRIKLLCAKLVFFRFFLFLWAVLTNIPRALPDNIRCKRTQHTICKVTLHDVVVTRAPVHEFGKAQGQHQMIVPGKRSLELTCLDQKWRGKRFFGQIG